MNESSHLTERNYSYCSGGVTSSTSLRSFEPWMPGPANYQNTSSSANLMMKAKCISVQPRGFSSYSNWCTHNPGDENDSKAASFLQSGKTLNYVNLQLHQNKEKAITCSSISSGKLHSASLKLPKETESGDQTMEHDGNLGEENCKLSQNNEHYLAGNKQKKTSFGDEMSSLSFPYAQPRLECKILQKSKTVADGMSAMSETVKRKGCASAMEDSSHSSPRVGDCIKECSDNKDCVPLKLEIAIKKEEISDTSMEGSIPGVHLTPDEVIGVIGQRLFLKARETIVQ